MTHYYIDVLFVCMTAPLIAGGGSSGKATPLLQSTDSSEPFDVNRDDGVARKVVAPR